MDANRLHQLLTETSYPEDEIEYLVNGFRHGFSLHYQCPTTRKDLSNNLPLTIGTKEDLWNKVMKEVKEKRFAGPFKEIPFDNYVQSPIGLVPKDNGRQTRLIFHLSYDFKFSGNRSVNFYTPEELCSVKYNDLDYAMKTIFAWSDNDDKKQLIFASTDVKSAFRLVPLSPDWYYLLIMKCEDPESGETAYFL